MSDIKYELLEQYVHRGSRRHFMSIVSKIAGLGSAAAVVAVAQGTGTPSTGGSATSAATDLNVLNYALTLEFLEASFYNQFLGMGTVPSGSTSLSGLTGTVTGNPRAFTTSDLSGVSAFQGYPAVFSTGLFGLLTQIRDHELAHVAKLLQVIKSLGGVPTQPCTYTFPVNNINDFLMVAQALENTGVSAYDGAINMITNPALVQAGATIATVEARHASFLNLVAGGGLVTGNFQPAVPSTGTPGGTGGTTPAAPAIPGVSASPFPTAFDTPLTMAQVLAIAKPFLASCPTPLGPTTVLAAVSPSASTSAPFTANMVMVDLTGSVTSNGQPVQQYTFSVPGSASSYCPTVTSGSSASAVGCPLVPAILQRGNSPMATIQFVNGSGIYPVQVSITDSTGTTSSQILVFAYQAAGGTTIPATTPGLTIMSVTGSSPSTAPGSGTGGH